MLKILSVFICIVFWGCSAPILIPGKLEVSKGSIQAQGTIATAERGGALIRTMQIDLTTPPSEFLEDIWVEIRLVGKTKLANVTTQLLKEQGCNEVSIESPREGSTVRYRDGGFSFDFNREGKLVYVESNTGSNDDTSTENPSMGSFSCESSLALPCSVSEFRGVFDKPDKVRYIKVK